jgi:type II secretory pathway component PulF
MKSYKYIARDLSGTRKEGLAQAVSTTDVLSWLREQGFTPVSVDEISLGAKKIRRIPYRRRIKAADLAALCWQLTTLLEGGVPITIALETIAEDIENLQLQQVLQQVVERMRRGESVSDSIAQFPRVFNRLFCAMVLAGETSGNLPTALHRLAEYFDNRDKLIKKIRSAVTYPIFVFVFVVAVVTFIMTFIIPHFRTIFDKFGGELPAFTQAFMNFYDALRANLVYIAGSVLVVIIFAMLTYSKTRKGHYLFSKTLLALPLFGKLFTHAFLSMFCRTMSALIAAGVPILEVLEILSAMTSNDIIKSAIIRTREHIVEGSNISLGMGAAGFFPNVVIKMVQVGEESGSMNTVLDKTSVYYERKVDATIATVMALIEPMMIITVGAIVLVVLLAMYLPIFTRWDIT